jgi:hypothetical protein
MNIHVPEEIRNKYPHMEFRGKKRILKNRTVIEAYNPATNMNFFYSFEEDFFWITNCELPDWKIRI